MKKTRTGRHESPLKDSPLANLPYIATNVAYYLAPLCKGSCQRKLTEGLFFFESFLLQPLRRPGSPAFPLRYPKIATGASALILALFDRCHSCAFAVSFPGGARRTPLAQGEAFYKSCRKCKTIVNVKAFFWTAACR